MDLSDGKMILNGYWFDGTHADEKVSVDGDSSPEALVGEGFSGVGF